MTTNEIFNVLNNINGCKIVAIEYTADVRMNKRGNPLASFHVTKTVKMTAQFGYNYQNAVNNRAEKNGNERDFVADSLPWGEWLVPNKFISNGGEIYVRFYAMKNGTATINYFIDGNPASEAEIAIIRQFTPARKESAKQAEHGIEGADQVRPFAIKLDNIIGLTYKGN